MLSQHVYFQNAGGRVVMLRGHESSQATRTMRMCQVAVAHAGAIQPLVQLLRDEAHLG